MNSKNNIFKSNIKALKWYIPINDEMESSFLVTLIGLILMIYISVASYWLRKFRICFYESSISHSGILPSHKCQKLPFCAHINRSKYKTIFFIANNNNKVTTNFIGEFERALYVVFIGVYIAFKQTWIAHGNEKTLNAKKET